MLEKEGTSGRNALSASMAESRGRGCFVVFTKSFEVKTEYPSLVRLSCTSFAVGSVAIYIAFDDFAGQERQTKYEDITRPYTYLSFAQARTKPRRYISNSIPVSLCRKLEFLAL